MADLTHAINVINRQIASPTARCAIVDEGFPAESSLLGTRDGYLRLARCLLQFVNDADNGRAELEDSGAWDDQIKSVLYQLPTHSAWVVGCYLFSNHDEFIAKLRAFVDPQIGYPLTNDPQFKE